MSESALRFRSFQVLIICVSSFASFLSYAQTTPADLSEDLGEPKHSVWTSEFHTFYFDLTGTGRDNFGVHSAALVAGFSRARIRDRYILRGGFGFVVGPQDKSTLDEINIFLSGTHFELGAATSLMSEGFRTKSQASIFGIQTSISYDELKGESDRIRVIQNGTEKSTYSKHSLEFSLLTTWVGVCVGQWKPARPDNNKVENLLTRIEGWSLSLDYGVPMITSYRAMYNKEFDDEDDAVSAKSSQIKFSGDLSGGVVRMVLRIDLGG